MNRHRPSDHGRVMGDGGPAGGSALAGPAGVITVNRAISASELWEVYVRWLGIPEWVIRAAHGFPCCDRDPVSGFLCEKRPGHHLFRDGRRIHRANEPHTGEMARTYPATWVHIWTTVRSVTTTREPIRL